MDTQRILVVDVGTFQVKVYWADVKKGQIHIDREGVVPSVGFKKGEIQDVKALGNAIRQAISCTNVGGNDRIDSVIVGISGMQLTSHFALGSVTLPSSHVCKSDVEHVNNSAVFMVTSEDVEVLHIIPKQYRLDGCICSTIPLGKSGTILECECSLITVSKTILAQLTEALHIAGIKADYFLASIFSVHEMISKYLEQKSYLLVDIGAGNTEVILYEDNQLVKIYSLPMGGEYISHDIMQGIDLDFEHAEKLKRYFSKLDADLKGKNIILDCSDEKVEDKNVQYDFLYDIIDSRVDEIINIVYDTISLELIDRDIHNIYFTGGCSLLYNFSHSLQRKFAMNVNPLVIEELAPEYLDPKDITGYGLLHYAGENLLDEEIIEVLDEKTTYQSIFSKLKKILKL
jgi:cell division protein FtsA